jgi:hypothetical protein
MQPYEIIMCPADLYIAYEGETVPAVDAVPGGNWVLLGSNGKRNQNTAGVKVVHSETLKFHSTAGATGNVKAIRTSEDLAIELVMEDLTLETYAKAMNGMGVREVVAASTVAGYKSFGLRQGFDVTTWALLIRLAGASPYGDGMNMQWAIPKAVENGAVTLVFDSEGNAAGIALKYMTLEDPNASSDFERFGVVQAQTAYALP